MRNNENTRLIVKHILPLLPEEQHFDAGDNGPYSVKFQCWTQAAFAELRKCFPGCVWEKKWCDELLWWEFIATWHEWTLRVYACHEAPKTCTPIMETRTVTKRIPVEFRDEEIEETVVVGYDCK